MSALDERTLHVNEIELACELHGEGEPILLLHGFGGCARDWQYAGRDELARHHRLIVPDARGHGRSSNPLPTISHAQCARDVLALLDALGIERCKAIGMSLGANTLLHVATLARERIEAMVLVSGTPYFPAQARALMAATLPPAQQPPAEWQAMRERHARGDAQIAALWRAQREFADDYDDLSFTPARLSRIAARTLIVYGDRDPLYPLELGLELYRSIPKAALCVVPNGGHGPIFLDAAPSFVATALAFLAG